MKVKRKLYNGYEKQSDLQPRIIYKHASEMIEAFLYK